MHRITYPIPVLWRFATAQAELNVGGSPPTMASNYNRKRKLEWRNLLRETLVTYEQNLGLHPQPTNLISVHSQEKIIFGIKEGENVDWFDNTNFLNQDKEQVSVTRTKSYSTASTEVGKRLSRRKSNLQSGSGFAIKMFSYPPIPITFCLAAKDDEIPRFLPTDANRHGESTMADREHQWRSSNGANQIGPPCRNKTQIAKDNGCLRRKKVDSTTGQLLTDLP